MAIQFPSNIQLNALEPLDTRYVVADESARLALQYVYSGLIVYLQDVSKLFLAVVENNETTWRQIESSDAPLFATGYYFNDDFYTDTTYQTKIDRDSNKIYIDINSSHLGGFYSYRYNDSKSSYEALIGKATDIVSGVMKLYSTSGTNEDGTMTQKSITQGVQNIKFDVEYTEDTNGDSEITTDDDGCLVLKLPW